MSVCLLCCSWIPSALAQNAPTVTDAQIEAMQLDVREPTEAEIESARRKHRMPSEVELARVPVPGTPKIDLLPVPEPRSIDLEALAKRFDESRERREGQPGFSGPVLMVFVTLAMPEAALDKLIEQASRSGAVLVMRGLKNGSMRQTAQHVHKLIGKRKVAWQIDPEAFDRFRITAAPAFVLVKAGAQPRNCDASVCMPEDAFVSVAGDVSIDYALKAIERRAPRFAPEARGYLKRIEG